MTDVHDSANDSDDEGQAEASEDQVQAQRNVAEWRGKMIVDCNGSTAEPTSGRSRERSINTCSTAM